MLSLEANNTRQIMWKALWEKQQACLHPLKPISMNKFTVSPQESMYAIKNNNSVSGKLKTSLILCQRSHLRSGTDKIPTPEYHWMPVENNSSSSSLLLRSASGCVLLSITLREPRGWREQTEWQEEGGQQGGPALSKQGAVHTREKVS